MRALTKSMPGSGQEAARRPPRGHPPIPLEAIQEAVQSVRHGVVQLIIQDGRVVQIDRTEKMRLT